MHPPRRHLYEPTPTPSRVDVEPEDRESWVTEVQTSAAELSGAAPCPGAMKAGDVAASWRERLGGPSYFCSCWASRPQLSYPGHWQGGLRCRHPSMGVRNKPELAILFGSCSLFPSSVKWSNFFLRGDVFRIKEMIYLKSLVPGRKQAFKGSLLLRF